jgi:hypothetical protein
MLPAHTTTGLTLDRMSATMAFQDIQLAIIHQQLLSEWLLTAGQRQVRCLEDHARVCC